MIINQNYNELTIETNKNSAKVLSDIISSLGAEAISYLSNGKELWLSEGIEEPILVEEIQIKAIFDENYNIQIIDSILKDTFKIKWKLITPDDWVDKWKDNLDIININDKLNICPSWLNIPNNNLPNLILDPGLAFGTGGHETTFLCLELITTQNLTNKIVLDLGCGSGILGISALLLGAEYVIFTDVDSNALDATLENCNKNNINPDSYSIVNKNNLQQQMNKNHINKFDLTIANILAKTIIELTEEILSITKKDGTLILSGILKDQVDSIKNNFPKLNFNTKDKNDWAALIGSRDKNN